MSEFKGTKGEWKILKNDFYCEIRIEESMLSICAINKKAKEHLANAKLIACAPEMLEALKYFRDNYNSISKEALLLTDELIERATL